MRMCTMQARCSRTRICTGIDVTGQTTRRLPSTGGFVPMASFRWPAVLCLGAAFALQAQPPARNLDLPRVAVDSAGQPVPGLTPSDFKVYDNGLAAEDRFRTLESNRWPERT